MYFNVKSILSISFLSTIIVGSFYCNNALSESLEFVETAEKCKVKKVDLQGTSLLETLWSGNCQDGFAKGPGLITRVYHNGATVTDNGVIDGNSFFDGHWTRKFSKNNRIDIQEDYFSEDGKTISAQCSDEIMNQQKQCKFLDKDNNGFILGELSNLGEGKVVALLCDRGACHQAKGLLDYSSAKPMMDIFDRQKHIWANSETILLNNNELYSQLNSSSSKKKRNSFATASKKLFDSYFTKEELLVSEIIESSIATKESIAGSKSTSNSLDTIFLSKESEVPVKIKMKISLTKEIFKPIADKYEANIFVILFSKYTVKTMFSSKKEYGAISAIQHITLTKENNYTAIVELNLGDLYLSGSSHLATLHMGDIKLDSADNVEYFIF